MAVYAEFSNATNLNNLLKGLRPHLTISPKKFYDDYFNIATCNSQGLDNWGRILNLSRAYAYDNLNNVWGFDTGQPLVDNVYPCNFHDASIPGSDNGTFVSGSLIPGQLSDFEYRPFLLLKYQYYTTNATLQSANFILNYFFQSTVPILGIKCAVTDGATTMSMIFTFNIIFTNEMFVLLSTRNILPVPLGVSYTIVQGVPL